MKDKTPIAYHIWRKSARRERWLLVCEMIARRGGKNKDARCGWGEDTRIGR